MLSLEVEENKIECDALSHRSEGRFRAGRRKEPLVTAIVTLLPLEMRLCNNAGHTCSFVSCPRVTLTRNVSIRGRFSFWGGWEAGLLPYRHPGKRKFQAPVSLFQVSAAETWNWSMPRSGKHASSGALTIQYVPHGKTDSPGPATYTSPIGPRGSRATRPGTSTHLYKLRTLSVSCHLVAKSHRAMVTDGSVDTKKKRCPGTASPGVMLTSRWPEGLYAA